MEVGIYLTQRCNFKCKHCLNECPYNEELSLEKYKEIINIFSNKDIKHITFTGGEPTIHKNFKEIVEFTVKKKKNFSIISNAYNYESYLYLVNYQKYFNTIVFSIEGLEKTHDSNRKKGSFAKVMDAIDFFSNKGITVKINLILTKYNYNQLEDILALLASKNVDTVHIGSVIKNNVNKDLLLDISKRREFYLKILYLQKKYKIKIVSTNSCYNLGNGFFCTTLDNEDIVYINQRAEIIYCCNIRDRHGKLGVLSKNNLKEIFDKKSKVTNLIRTDRLIKLLKGNLSEDEEHSCTYCNNFF